MGRWADTEEDAALEAKLKKEKEEKKRIKAEKARKAEEERQAQLAAQQAAAKDDDRPSKRRKVTPERDGAANDAGETRLLRFPLRSWTKSRSVESYEKLNDIEEGTYGWVSRAKESKTGKVVALKRLKIEPSDRNGLPVTGLREIQILRDCRHDNIVRLEEVVVGDDTSKIEK